MGVGCSVSERSFFLSDVRVMGFKDSTEKMKGKYPVELLQMNLLAFDS